MGNSKAMEFTASVRGVGRDMHTMHAELGCGSVNEDPVTYVPQNTLSIQFGGDVPFPDLEFGKTYVVTFAPAE